MLNILIGKARSGKSNRIYKLAHSKYLDGVKSYIFVPAQARILAEEEYIKANSVRGIIGVSITSFERYVSKEIENIGYISDKKYLTEAAKKLALKNEMNMHSDLFKIFKKVKDKPSFISAAITYIETIKKEELDTQKIFETNKVSTFLKSKLEEFINIYEKIKEEINSRFVDSVDELDIFVNNIENKKQSTEEKNKEKDKIEMFFSGYSNFSKKELKAIKAMLVKGYNITISLALDGKYIDNKNSRDSMGDYIPKGIFDQSYNTYFNLIDIAKSSGLAYNVDNCIKEDKNLEMHEDIKYLGENIFDDLAIKYEGEVKNVSINIYKNIYDEIECIAKEIYSNVFNLNARFKDYVIYTNDFIGYENAINKIFRQYNIPIYFDIGSKVKNNIISIYLKGMLELSKGFKENMDLVIEILKTGLNGESIDDIANFENYTREFGIKGYMLGSEFKANNKDGGYGIIYDLGNINGLRERIYNKIIEFRNSLKKCKLSLDYTREIYNYIEGNNISSIYFKINKDILRNNAEEESIATQMLKKIYEAMDNICLVNQDREVSLEEYADQFSFLIEDIEISTIPSYIDEVNILDINKSRIAPIKYVYIIGVYENGLPGANTEDNIFKDSELDELKEIGINIKETSLVRENMALFNIYMAINSALKQLKFTIPASKITGEPLRPSYIIDNIRDILDIKIIGNISAVDISNEETIDKYKYSSNINFKNMLECIVKIDSLSEEEIKKAYVAYLYFLDRKNGDCFDEWYKYREILQYTREDKRLSKSTLEMVYKESINSSVSRLEKFSSCPFSYLVNYILKLKENKEYKVTNMDMGNMLHVAIDTFSNILVVKSIKWQELIILEKENSFVTTNVDKIVDEMFGKVYSKYESSPRYIILKSKIKKSLVKILMGLSDSFNNSRFEPLGYEIKFGNGELFSPIEVKLDSGHTMLLTGKIDRVDSAKIGADTYIRVVDYKSSDKTLILDNIKEGLSLQLMAYMSALLENKDKIDKDGEVIPASISYLTITSKIINIKEYENDKEKVKKMLVKMLKNKGIYIKDAKILECIDKNFKDSSNSYIDISKSNINNKNKGLEKDIFLEECENIKKTLKEIGESITGGVVKIAPKSLNGKSPCEYCAYKNVCRKSIRG